MKLKIPQTLFKKKACVGDPNIYPIQVKVCQAYIFQRAIILPASAIKCGKFI